MIASMTAKKIFRYTIMPEFMTRINTLVLSGFQTIPFLIAVVYQIVRLLPNNHPYLNPKNIGRFGIRHVVAEAANNLVISRQNIDQIIIFVVILIGMVMISLQVFLIGVSVFMASAGAAPPAPDSWDDWFFVADPWARSQDIAFIMLDLVFGVPGPGFVPGVGPGFFESCVSTLNPCTDSYGLPIMDSDFSQHADVDAVMSAAGVNTLIIGPLATGNQTVFPFPVHLGLHALFGIYNLGLLVVAVMITCYFIATVIAETAQSGTPFGKRFNKLWAPIRIVVAFGLLMPLLTGANFGLNSGQYLVLYAAKFGSAFATNGWQRFNDTLTINYLNGAATQTISEPNPPEIESLSLFMWLVNVCYHISQKNQTPGADIHAFVIGRQNRTPLNTLQLTDSTTYNEILDFLDPNPKMITIRFGEKNQQRYPHEDGFVNPTCGEIQVPLTDSNKQAGIPPAKFGPYIMQNFYYVLIREMWFEDGTASPYVLADGGFRGRAEGFAHFEMYKKEDPCCEPEIDASYVNRVNDIIKEALDVAIDAAVAAQMNLDPNWLAGPCLGPGGTLQNKGWGAAAIWYNCLAEMNGSLTSSVLSIPVQTKYPEVMEKIAGLKSKYNVKTWKSHLFQPTVAGTKDTALLQKLGVDPQAAAILYKGYSQWMLTGEPEDNNEVTDLIKSFLGTSGLYNMRDNPDVHPLAQLVGVGRALVEAAIRKLGYAMVGAVASRLLNGADGGVIGGASTMMVSIAMLGLTAGFVLFYIVPFLPFIYFFFALGGWVKAIFEAMVGTPLWALAHIRIDGHGLPGNAALNGYFLIFEIFIRPILTLFGLLASVSIFAAMVKSLNDIFDLVIYNVSGFDMEDEIASGAADSVIESMRGTIDEFFFTIIYAVIVYMMAMSSFKLIDQIPNNILRWMGQSVATFGDTREDPAQGLMGKATMGAQQTFSKLGSGMSGVVTAIAKTN